MHFKFSLQKLRNQRLKITWCGSIDHGANETIKELWNYTYSYTSVYHHQNNPHPVNIRTDRAKNMTFPGITYVVVNAYNRVLSRIIFRLYYAKFVQRSINLSKLKVE